MSSPRSSPSKSTNATNTTHLVLKVLIGILIVYNAGRIYKLSQQSPMSEETKTKIGIKASAIATSLLLILFGYRLKWKPSTYFMVSLAIFILAELVIQYKYNK